ncbi:hypothetical protein LTR53_009039 [Teratosphaeriaceae sp. CCFEE 6253]|nr:hypothetical protein LTR53_009039 [Teratosphaeriaceae sp. CCFEE 6253]
MIGGQNIIRGRPSHYTMEWPALIQPLLDGRNESSFILSVALPIGMAIAVLGLIFSFLASIAYMIISTIQEERSQTRAARLRASDHINDGKHHLLLAATGSVATIKIPEIVLALSKYHNLSIRILLTDSAAKFLDDQAAEQPSLARIARLKNVDAIYRDAHEWRKPWVRGDSILHIELRRWADVMVIAPLSANSLAKVAVGMSDNLITSVVRAWDATGVLNEARPDVPLPYEGRKGIIVAPAMNTAMWHHPITAEHLRRLETDWSVRNGGWFDVLRPVEKQLACGDTGSGAMHDWKLIVTKIESVLHLSKADTSARWMTGTLG